MCSGDCVPCEFRHIQHHLAHLLGNDDDVMATVGPPAHLGLEPSRPRKPQSKYTTGPNPHHTNTPTPLYTITTPQYVQQNGIIYVTPRRAAKAVWQVWRLSNHFFNLRQRHGTFYCIYLHTNFCSNSVHHTVTLSQS